VFLLAGLADHPRAAVLRPDFADTGPPWKPPRPPQKPRFGFAKTAARLFRGEA
jgi:hypothetical protein